MTTASVRALVLALVLASPIAVAASASVVVPNALEFVEGNQENCIPVTGCLNFDRYQQVYAASQFGGALTIGELRFRRDGDDGPFSIGFSNVSIGLSTTSALPDALSTTFLSNRGLDFTVVHSGALTLSSPSSGGSPAPFDIVIPLQTPFAYDPSQGNLLLDWQSFGGETFNLIFYDAAGTAGDPISRLLATNANAATGSADTNGLVTQFVPVPEPASALLLAAGLAVFAFTRK